MNEMLVFGTPSTINAIAMSYHIDQQGIIPDCAYNIPVNYDPLNLPPYTIMVRYKPNTSPSMTRNPMPIKIQVSEEPNIWTVTYENPDWTELFLYEVNLVEVLGANTSDITNMHNLFGECDYLEKTVLFDTSSVTRMDAMYLDCALKSAPVYDTSNAITLQQMFQGNPLKTAPLLNTSNIVNVRSMFFGCGALESIPAYDLSNATLIDMFCQQCSSLKAIPALNIRKAETVSAMFYGCKSVESGILSLYQNLSQLQTITDYSLCFRECGINTVQGAAELAQIPSEWK